MAMVPDVSGFLKGKPSFKKKRPKSPRKNRKPRKLSYQEEIFCRTWANTLHGTKSALTAGYGPKGAAQQATNLLKQAKITRRIHLLMEQRFARLEISGTAVLAELGKLGFSNIQDMLSYRDNGDPYFDLTKLSRDQAAAIQSVKIDEYTEGRGEDSRQLKRVTVRLVDKVRALQLLGQYLKLFVHTVDIPALDNLANQIAAARKRSLEAQDVVPAVATEEPKQLKPLESVEPS